MTEDGLLGSRPGNDYLIKDDQAVLDFYLAHKDDPAKVWFTQCAQIPISGVRISQN